jgi:cell fate regulator YaaT (PSP1 superfamily)
MANYIVRYGAMRLLGVFAPTADQPFPRGTRVIVRTDRGLEDGEVLCEVKAEAPAAGEASKPAQILRAMTADDANELCRMHAQEREEFQTCVKCISTLGLEMELVDVEHVFGGERVIVYYLAEGRVDFRELVKMLAGEFQTRIEMRQIGVRDEAKLLADFGDCGKPVCCNTHLVQIPPVSMKMAKLQKATLDPSKISGRCGRLKCCLRYEYEMYETMQKELPPVGTRVVVREGPAKVVGHEILTAQLVVETDDHRRRLVSAAETPLAPDEAGPAAADSPAKANP